MLNARQLVTLLHQTLVIVSRLALQAALTCVLSLGVSAQDYPKYPAAGTTFVPLDSWVYPAFERLAGLGYVKSAIMGLKPWARTECARLTEEAQETLEARIVHDKHLDNLAAEIVDALEREFRHELAVFGGKRNRSAALESVYARVLSISGPPLTDGFHFGQTIDYDFGRPFRRGANAIAGASARATYGPLAAHFQGEYQHAPSAPELSLAVRTFISSVDTKPLEPAARFEPINRGRLLDSYVSLNIRNWQVSFGNQSLSWGVGSGGSLLLSNNADPLTMVRITRLIPHKLPGFLGILGPMRSEFFVTRMEGFTFVPRPYMYGQKITIRPSPNWEVGYGRTTLLGGGNSPFTTSTFIRSYFGLKKKGGFRFGDSRTSFDWSYRIPKLRDWLVFYGELFADDDQIFFLNVAKGIYRPGLRLTKIPGLPKADLSIEAANSEAPYQENHRGNVNYWNHEFRDGYTNHGNLMGNTVGRQGQAILVSSNYQIAPKQFLTLFLKVSSVEADYVPGGARWYDYGMRYYNHTPSGIYFRGLLQGETISKYPILLPGVRKNVSVSVEVGFVPRREH